MEGIDTKAIKIEDIAKSKEENEILEEEFFNDLKASLSEDELQEINEDNLDLKEIYHKYGKTSDLFNESIASEEYEDAFDHVEYLDEVGLTNDIDIEEMTEELYPGIRKLKRE
jgi:hypothetical protein